MLAVVFAAAGASVAFAHASLLSSDPADDTVLRTAPQNLTLTFSEPVDPQVLRLIDNSGAATDLSANRAGDSTLVMKSPSLVPGVHVLSWRVVSSDGHPIAGSIVFFVGHREAMRGGDMAATSVVAVRGLWISRLVVYLGLLGGCGGAFFISWIGVGACLNARRVVHAATIGGLVFLLPATGFQGLDLFGESGAALIQPGLWTAALAGSFGGFVVCAVLALLAAIAALRLSGTAGRMVALLALLGVGVAFTATGHAASANPRWLMIPAVFIHGTALAFWIGALAPLGMALNQPTADSAATLKRFSRWIPWSLAPVLVAGLVLATVQLGSVDALATSDYGQVFLAKLIGVALLLLLAALNRYRFTDRAEHGEGTARQWLRRAIAAELLLVVLIVGVSGLWRFTVPPRLSATEESFFTHLHAEKAMADITIRPAHPGSNTVAVSLQTSDERPLDAKELEIVLSNPDAGIEPIRRTAKRGTDGLWQARFDLPVAGRWTAGLDILISDFEQVSAEVPVLVNSPTRR